MSLNQLSAFETAQKVKSGEIKASAMVEAALYQIKNLDGAPGSLEAQNINPEEAQKVHAFIRLSEDLAFRQAEAIEQKIENGEDPGLLAGVPVSIKDIFTLEGSMTTAASKILANFKAPYTATSVQRLIDAGALIMGKVNLDEFTFGSSNESSAFQPATSNP